MAVYRQAAKFAGRCLGDAKKKPRAVTQVEIDDNSSPQVSAQDDNSMRYWPEDIQTPLNLLEAQP